jgi:ElaB/YqjD/DUF883 family membrane-anchored ribosome-binding protein
MKKSSNEGSKATNRAMNFVRDNPLGFVLAGLAIGLAAGALAPVTELERRKVAPVRDELLEHAQAVAGDAVGHGKRVLEETLSAVTDSASKHGQALVSEAQHEFGLQSADR